MALTPALEEKIRALQRAYENALLSRETNETQKIIDEALEKGAHPLEIYERMIIPTQVSVGDRWHEGEIGIAEEHLATQESIEQVNRLRSFIHPRASLNRKVIVGSLSGDKHWLGARMVADHFYQDGWSVDFLGTSPPVVDLIDYIKRSKADLVLISVTMEADIEVATRLAQKLISSQLPTKLILGGQAFQNPKKAIPESLKQVPIVNNPQEALRLGRKLCGIDNTTTTVNQLLKDIGVKLSARRKQLGLSQKEVALSSGLDRAYLSSLESGKHNFSIAVLVKLCSTLNMSLESIFQTEISQ